MPIFEPNRTAILEPSVTVYQVAHPPVQVPEAAAAPSPAPPVTPVTKLSNISYRGRHNTISKRIQGSIDSG